MPNGYIDKVTLNGTTYNIKDTTSGYTSEALTSAEISAGTSTTNKLISAKTLSDALSGLGGGTITGVTAGTGLTGGGTTGGVVTLNHSNSVTAQNTQAVYPIKIDGQGHISSYGSAVTIPTVPTAGTTATAVSTTSSGGSATTWSKSDHVHSISSSTITSALGFTPASTNVASSTANGLMSSSDKSKLDGLSPTGQVQADWDVSDSSSAAFIRNKPTDVSDFTNDAGYLTQSTLGSALEANSAIVYNIIYTSGQSGSAGIYSIENTTIAEIVANIVSEKKVIFKQVVNDIDNKYWFPYEYDSLQLCLYQFEQGSTAVNYVKLMNNIAGNVRGTENAPYYLSEYNYDPYAVGKVIITSSRSDDPNNYLSGSWTLIDKEFAGYNRHEISGISANTTNTNSVSLVASRMGHDVYLQATINNKVAISTTNLELFTMPSISILGLTDRIDVSYFYFLGYCDNANAAAMMDIDYSGRVRSLNVLTRGNATSIAAGNVITATFTLHNPPHNMADSFCDKFYWQRYS